MTSRAKTEFCAVYSILVFTVFVCANSLDPSSAAAAQGDDGSQEEQQAANRTQANAEEAARLGVDKLFGTTRLRGFKSNPKFTPDGKHVIGCSAWKFKIINVETGETREAPMTSPIDVLGRYAISPDGTRAVILGQLGSFTVWNTETGDAVVKVESDNPGAHIRGMAWSPDGTRVVIGDYRGGVKVWNAQTGERISAAARRNPGPGTFLDRAAWSPGDKYYACGGGGGDYPTFVYSAKTHEEVRRIDSGIAHRSTAELAGMEFVSDDKLLICGPRAVESNGEEQIVTDLKLWDLETGEVLQSFPRAAELGEPDAICLTPDRAQVIVKAGEVIRFFDVANGAVAKEFASVPTTPYCQSLDVSPDGSMIVYGSEMLFILDAETGAWLHSGDENGHIGSCTQSLSPDSELLLTIGRDDGRLIFWDTETCRPVSSIALGKPLTRRGHVWAPDGGMFYFFANRVSTLNRLTDEPFVVMAFDPVRKVKVYEAEFPNSIGYQECRATISADSKQLILFYPGPSDSGGQSDGAAVVQFVDAKNGRPLRRLEIPGLGRTQPFRLTPDGKFFLTTFFRGDPRFKIWDAETGEFVHGEKGLDRGLVSYSRDCSRFVGVSDEGEAVVYDTMARRELHRIKVPGKLVGSAHIISDKWFAVSTYRVEEVDGERTYSDRETSIWDIESGQRVHTLNTPRGSSMMLSADGRYVYGSLGVPVAWEFERYIDKPD